MFTYWLFPQVDWSRTNLSHDYVGSTWRRLYWRFFSCTYEKENPRHTKRKFAATRRTETNTRSENAWASFTEWTNKLVDAFEIQDLYFRDCVSTTSCCQDFIYFFLVFSFFVNKKRDHVAPSSTKWCWMGNLKPVFFLSWWYGVSFLLLLYYNLVDGGRWWPNKTKGILHCIA